MDINNSLYKKLYLIRKVEEVIQEYYHEDGMKTPMHMSKGSEAISAGVCQALNQEDQVLGTYRSHALYLSKTEDIEGFFLEMYGKEKGICKGKSGSMHLSNIDKGYISSSAIVGSNISVALGIAFANKFLDNGKITAVFFGDGAVDEGCFWESINIACLYELPILFVCENNNLAVHTPANKRHGYKNLVDIIKNFYLITCESFEVEADKIYKDTIDILNRMRKKNFPGFIEFSYYRHLEHVGINEDFSAGYREKNRLEDPVLSFRKKLNSNDTIDIETTLNQRIQKSLEAAKIADFSDLVELEKGVYYE